MRHACRRRLGGALALRIAATLLLSASAPASATDRIFRNGFEPGITAPAETWTWVPFSNARCGDGSTAGIGVNFTSASDRLLIYLQGGGACWDYATCYLFDTATNFTGGYSELDFEADVADDTGIALPGGFFDRTAAANPFRDYSYVFVPYCTGDTHAGSNVTQLKFLTSTKTAYFVGYANLRAYLDRLSATFTAPGRVVLAGSSAGGFGAVLNWWQAAEAFPGVRTDMIDDSGAVMPNDVLSASALTEQQTQRTVWNLAAAIPPGCSGCATAFDPIYAFDSATFPGSRGALLSYTQDSVLPTFYGISTSSFTTGLFETEAQNTFSTGNLRYFDEAGSGHVLWFSPALTSQTTSVLQFVTKMVEDDPGWSSVGP